ncbi:MAG: hypothetical protein PHV74_12740 [Dehalococcoidia bacterium]|nr:hypothetical protein [Dehalococcoidia bacterium]
MTDSRLGEIKALQKKIVLGLEHGEDISELSHELARVRQEIAAAAEVEELQKVADQRKALKDRAEAVKTKIERQGQAIDSFLRARDEICKGLAPIIERAKGLPKVQSECYAEYHDPGQLCGQVRLPEGYLPKALKVPMLEGRDGIADAHDRAAQAYFYLSAGLGLLQSLKREDRPFPERPAGEFEAIEESETFEEPPTCSACAHAQVEMINQRLKEGVSLRTLEEQFGISKSTLSRHKRKCLGIEAVRMVD